MESLKDFITPTTFSIYGYIVTLACPIIGAILSVVTGSLRDKERRNFHCYVEPKSSFNKNINFLRASCFTQYDQQYNSPLPLYGFVLLSFIIQTFISLVYSWCCVKSRVEEVEQELKIDAENPRPRRAITTRRVFSCYVTQLFGRFSLGILFTVLQNFVLYPSGFPSSFACELKLEKTKVPETNTTLSNVTSSFIDCENSIGSDKDVWAMIVWIVNTILALLVAGELILMRRACRNLKTFMTDSEFCQRYLFNRRKTPRIVDEYRRSQRRRIMEDTQALEPLIPPLPGENEDCKNLDDVYVNLIIHTGRSRPSFDMERMDKLGIMEEYIKSPDQLIRINELQELLQPNEDSNDPRKILILGCPGIGKTLLCRKLFRELSKLEAPVPEEANERFHHLFLFHFRNFNSEEMKTMSLQSLLSRGKYSEGKLDGEMLQSVLENPGKVLLVFDGLDEFKDHKKCMDEEKKHPGNGITEDMSFAALYVKLVKGNILKGATVLTTTRPYAVDSVRGLKFDRTVEILGFSTQKVKEYCTKFFRNEQSTKERIWQHVESNLNLLYLCYIPVNCFIVCSLLEKIVKFATSSLEGATLPTRLTEIYEGALRLFIFKHHPKYQSKTLETSDLTSNKTFCPSLEKTLSRLEELAWKGIEERRLVFELEEVQGMENCGLLNRMPDVESAPFTYKPQFCFIHLTMQEFVAARGIAKMDPQDLQEFVSSKVEDEKWHLVIQFVVGLLRDKETIVNELFHDDYDTVRKRSKGALLLMMNCLYEANSISCVKSAAAKLKSNSMFNNFVDLSHINLTPVDCTAVVSFVKHIDNLRYLNVSGNPSVGDGGCSELSKLIKSGGPQGLNVGNCGISDQGLITVLEAMKTAETCNLSQLDIHGNEEITDEGYSYLSDTLMDEKCKLTRLGINFTGNPKFSNALKHRNCRLNMLHLHSLHDQHFESCEDIERAYGEISSALMNENCKVTDLRFDDRFVIPHVGMPHVCKALVKENCKLTKLVFFKRNVTDNELLCVFEALKHKHWKFTELWFFNSYLFNAAYLDVLEHTIVICNDYMLNSTFQVSDLGISSLCTALKHKDSKLKKLRVRSSFLTQKSFDDLQNAILHDNCKLENLRLRCDPTIPETMIKSDNFVCNIMTINGKTVLAKKGDSGQYEEIVLSKLDFHGVNYSIQIGR